MTIFASYSEASRRGLFFGVCLPVRLCFSVVVVALYHNEPATMAGVGLVGALLALVINRWQAKYDDAWWQRWPHMLVAAAIATVSGVAMISPVLENNLHVWVAVMLAADLAWSVYAGATKFCGEGVQ